MISIYKQLRQYFLIVTIISVLVIFILSNAGMAIFFNNYIQESSLKSDQKIVQYIEDLFQTETGQMMGNISGLIQFVRGEDAEIKLRNMAGELVLDSRSMTNMYRGMGMGMGRGPMTMQPDTNSLANKDLEYREYPIQEESQIIGKVEIGREKTLLASAQDRAFFLTMNLVYLIALGLSILLVFMMSKYVTGKFLHPLLIVKRNIQLIAGRGNKTLEPIASRTTEIEELAQATVELSRALAEQDKLRKRLTSDVAHELRTPLATLQSHLEAMIDGIWEPTPERLSYCYDELIRLTRLISDLNELSVIENDRVQLNISDVNLTKLLNDMVENFQPLFSEKNITFTSYLQENIQVTGDKDRLKQIFVNILSNAFKYTQEQGSVNVELAAEKDRVIVTVRDTGVGIPGQDLPHIFERFYRGDLSRNRQSGGAGIGLTIAKALIEAHDGSLEIESEHTVGTIVKIALPSQVT